LKLNSDDYGCKPQTGRMKPAMITLLFKHEFNVNSSGDIMY